MMDLGDGCFFSTPDLDEENPFNQNLNTEEELSDSQKPTQPLFEVGISILYWLMVASY